MRTSSSFLALTFLLIPRLITATILLEQFGQVLVGFPAACSAAYNAPITGCSASDFTGPSTCSNTCVAALNAVTVSINAACVGSKADPNSLIGLFFQGKGTAALCPTGGPSTVTASTSGGDETIVGTQTMTASSLSTLDTSIAHDTSTKSLKTASQTTSTGTVTTTRNQYTQSTTSQSPTPTSMSTSTATETSTSTPSSTEISSSGLSTTTQSSSATALASTTLQTTSSHTSTPSASQSRGQGSSSSASPSDSNTTQPFTSTAVENGSATVLTSLPDRTDSSNADSFGGGGSPFEISGAARSLDSKMGTRLLIIAGAMSALVAIQIM